MNQSTVDNSIDNQLRQVLEHHPFIHLAILFGSVAKGTAGFESDLDIAVQALRPLTVPQMMALIEDLAEMSGRPIDLIDLSTVGEPLLGQIIAHGRRILGSDTDYTNAVLKHIYNEADFVPLQKRILKEPQRGMDWQVIEQKLESLRRSLKRIREKCPDSSDGMIGNYDAQDIISLNISRAVQMCVDIGAHIVTSSGYAAPSTMAQTFETLANLGILSQEIANRMKKAVGFRNIGVHSYDSINWDMVFAIATKHLSDFDDFAQAIVSLKKDDKG